MEVAREYYELTEKRKSLYIKRKRLESEREELKTKRTGKRARLASIKSELEDVAVTDQEAYFALVRFKNKYSGVKSPYEEIRERVKHLIEIQRLRIDFLLSANHLPLLIELSDASDMLASLIQEVNRLPHGRPLFVIPAVTLPLSMHPEHDRICLHTGTLNADIWHHILYTQNRATLRQLRLCCISLAILVHSMPPMHTGYLFCT